MAKVTQEFSAVGEDKVAAAYRKLAQENENLLRKNAQLAQESGKLHEQVKKQAAELESLTGRRLAQLSAEIQKTQELKRARGELITTTNWVQARADVRGMAPTTICSNAAPPAPLRLGYRGDASRGMVSARHPYFTMEDADIPKLGYDHEPRGLTVPAGASPRALQMSDPIGPLIGRQMRVVGQMLAGLVGVETLLRAFNQQLEWTVDRQRDAAAAHKRLAEGHAEILLNTFGESAEEQQQRFADAQRISLETGLPVGVVAKTIGRQAGRGMNLTREQQRDAAEMAARLARHNPEQYEPLAGGIQQTMRIGKTDAKTAASLFMSGAANTYIGDPTLQARFLTHALSGGVASVPNANLDTIEQVMELGAWISQEVGEERGEAGRTSVIALLAEMDQFGRGEGPWMEASPWGGRPRKRPVKGFPNQPKDRIEWLQNNPGQRERFMRHFSERRLFEGTYQRMFETGSQSDLNWREMQDRVRPDQQSLEHLLQGLQGQTPALKAANAANRTKAAMENADIQMSAQALRDEAMTIRDETLKKTSQFPLQFWYETLGLVTRPIADATGFGTVEGRALEELRTRRSGGTLNAYQASDPEARAAAELLDKQIKRLEEIRDEIKKMNGGPTPSAAPAMNGQRGLGNER